ncbi:MAG TPA: hypothetical protein VFV38_39930 [Ktedonobacteraceae bacterium]|nr:hypothetical protein [Ktedonobacteraceae bacterium]
MATANWLFVAIEPPFFAVFVTSIVSYAKPVKEGSATSWIAYREEKKWEASYDKKNVARNGREMAA